MNAIPETETPEKKKRKRPSQGMRKYIRRMKQEARKGGMTDAELKKRTNRA
jgi:hypothetical protein